MIHEENTAPHNPEGHDDTLDAHYSSLERLDAPHGCYEGLVFVGHLIEEDGEEVEVVETIPCRRCADNASVVQGA